jgi:hypothetical protein
MRYGNRLWARFRAPTFHQISSCARTNAIDFEGSIRGLMEVLLPVLDAAKKNQVLINFDDSSRERPHMNCSCAPTENGLHRAAMQAYRALTTRGGSSTQTPAIKSPCGW